MKKLLSLLLSAAMVLSMIAVAAPAASAAEKSIQAVVHELTVEGNTVYLYVPESELAVASCATAPVFLVFGEKAYTAETAKTEAVASGLAKLAAREGASVAFINPQGATWTDADEGVFLALQDRYSDSFKPSVNGMTEDGTIMGAVESRVYIYANGAGADFAASKYMKIMEVMQLKGNGDTIPVDRTAVSFNLFNISTLPVVTQRADIAVAVINGPADAAQKLAALTSKVRIASSNKKDGFDAEWITANYDTFSGAYRRQAGFTLPTPNYAAEGIIRSIESFTLASGREVGYVVFHGTELNVTDKNSPVPLVLMFHGGGNTALGYAQNSQWPQIAKANGLLAVSVDQHTSYNATEMVELLGHLKEEFSIDASRIYASGFSMGGVKSWGLIDEYPELLAGAAPMNAFVVPPEGKKGGVLVPTFYSGGQDSPLKEMANRDMSIVSRYEDVFANNKVARTYSYNAAENLYWGMNGDITYQVTDRVAMTNSTLNVNLYKSTDGKYYTAFADSTNQSHEVYLRNAWAAWDFLSQFSRNKDGSISISKTTYTLPSDDGSVTSNNYNIANAGITELTVEGTKNTVIIYAPESALGTAATWATAPSFMVFGDKAYTAETAATEAVSSGLAQLAASEGAVIAFVNPQGKTWGNADKGVFLALQGMYSDSGNSAPHVNGISEKDGKIIGAEGSRIYIYANGAGADFVAANYLKNLDTVGERGVEGHTAASVTLFNVKNLPTITESVDMAIAVINGPADAYTKAAALSKKNIVTTSNNRTGFDSKWILDNYTTFSGAYRRHVGVTIPVHHYANEGIQRTVNTFTTKDGTVITYVVFRSQDLNVTDKNNPVPLVMLFHGAGNSALGFTQFSEWPEIAKENGLLAVAVDQHLSVDAHKVAELMEFLKQEFSIDNSRVYASGFSMGGQKTWSMFDLYPSLFAAVAPTQLCLSIEENRVDDVLLPVFYVAGQDSPLPESAKTSEGAVDRYKAVFASNKVVGASEYKYDANVNAYWGRNGDLTYQITDSYGLKSTLNVNLYKSVDGNVYTAFADAANESHEVYARNYWAAWDFMKQFTRKADGSISVSKVSYTLPSDDGSVTGNSYNLAVSFDDVAPNAPYAEAVRMVAQSGIMVGVGNNKFDPDGAVTRAQAITVLGRLAGVEEKVTNSFTDVDASAWYAGYVGWAVENGIVQGDGNGHFMPNEFVTSAHLNLMLQRYAQLAGIKINLPDTAGSTVSRAELAQRLMLLMK